MTYNDHFQITPSGSLFVDADADAHVWVTSSMVELLGDLNTSETTVLEFERTLKRICDFGWLIFLSAAGANVWVQFVTLDGKKHYICVGFVSRFSVFR